MSCGTPIGLTKSRNIMYVLILVELYLIIWFHVMPNHKKELNNNEAQTDGRIYSASLKSFISMNPPLGVPFAFFNASPTITIRDFSALPFKGKT